MLYWIVILLVSTVSLQQAAVLLIDANGDDYMGIWQHDFIIRAFLCQGHERLALKYVKLKGIPALTADDIKLRMTVLLANGYVISFDLKFKMNSLSNF